MTFRYVPHPRVARRHAIKPPKVADAAEKVHGDSLIGRINRKVGLKITMLVGTMWAAYLFTVLALFALPDAIQQGTYFVIVWLSSSFLQLVLLPIIIVGQNIQAKAADARSQATFDDTTAILAELKQIQAHLLTQDATPCPE